GGKSVLEDGLERDERHQGLRTRDRRRSSGCFLQYHANHPRDKRLVQGPLCSAWPSVYFDTKIPATLSPSYPLTTFRSHCCHTRISDRDAAGRDRQSTTLTRRGMIIQA